MSRLTQRTRRHMRVLAALTAATVGYSGMVYLDAPRLLGVGYYDIQVELTDGGGLYEGSLVTLSGVEVGEVTDLETGPEKVTASIRLENGAEIPRTARAAIRSISAAGEQYLDLAEPRAHEDVPGMEGDGNYEEGDTIPALATSQPVTTADLLRRLDELVTSVPVDDLNTTVDEVGVGLGDGAEDLDKFLDAILPLQEEFTENLEPTQDLIVQAEQVLGTQVRTERDLRTAATQLAAFTDTLAESDQDLRGTLADVPVLTDDLTRLVEDLGPTTPELLEGMGDIGEVTSEYDAAVRHILTVLPGVTSAFQTALNVSPVEGSVSLFARSVVNDPPACTRGFIQERRSPREVTPILPPTKVYCQVEQGSPQAVRGARNYPCPGGARRGPSAAACGLEFQDPQQVADVQREALNRQVASARKYLVPGAQEGTQPYDPLADIGPLDGLLSLLDSAYVDSGSAGWQSLVLDPLGLS